MQPNISRSIAVGFLTFAIVASMLGPIVPSTAALALSDGTTPFGDGRAPIGIEDAADIAEQLPEQFVDDLLLLEVTLTVPFVPEAALSKAESGLQQARIAQAQEEIRLALQGTPHEFVHNLESVPGLFVRVSREALDALLATELVASIHEPGVATLHEEAERQSLSEEEQDASPSLAESSDVIGATAVNLAGFRGSGQTVAVIDTGIEADHPFFGGRIVAEACYSVSGDCPGDKTELVGPGAGEPCTFSGDCDHGTHVAGIVAGSAENRSGAAPESSLISINVASDKEDSDRPVLRRPDVIRGLEYIYSLRDDYDIAAVNMSLGGGSHASTCDGIEPLYDKVVANLTAAGIAVIASSGNGGRSEEMAWPACQSQTISVGNTTTADVLSGSSNSSPVLDLLAPGSQITSAVLDGTYATKSGTSMAAPQVAGAFAVLGQALPTAGSTERVADRLSLLKDTGAPVTDDRQGRVTPRIDVHSALSYELGRCVVDDRYQAWDKATTATPIFPNRPIDAVLCPDDIDAFAVEAFTGDTLDVDLSHVPSEGELELRVYDPVGNVLGESTSGDTRSVQASAATSGTYRIEVTGADPGVENAYQLDVGLAGCPPDDPYEPNNSWLSGPLLSPDEPLFARLCTSPDYFRVHVDKGDTVTARLAHISSVGQLRLSVFGPSGSGFTAASGDDLAVSLVADESGEHVVLVRGVGDGVTNPLYRLEVNTPTTIPSALPEPPANDAFDAAASLGGHEGEVAATNIGASVQPEEPDHVGHGSHSVWWAWEAPSDGSATFSTRGSDFDTVLAVYTGDSVGQLTEIASNDDNGVDTLTWSHVEFEVEAGSTYYVAVDGYREATGDIQLAWDLAELGVLVADPLSIDVGQVELDEAGTVRTTLTNEGGSTVVIEDLVLTGSSAFSILEPQVPYALEPGAEVEVDVEFVPTTEGQVTANVAVIHSGQNSPLDVSLTGEGTPAPELQSDPNPQPDPEPEAPVPPLRVPAPEVPVEAVEPEVPEGSTVERERGTAGAVVDGVEVETSVSAPEVAASDPDVPPTEEEVEQRRTVTRQFVDEVLAAVPEDERGVSVVDTDDGAAIVGLLADRDDATLSRPVPPTAVAAVSAGDVRLLAAVTDRRGNPRDRAADGALRGAPGGDAAVRMFGLPAEADGQVQVRSTARVLGVVSTDDAGRLASQVELPGDLPPGDHTLVVTVGGATVSVGISVEADFPDVAADSTHVDAIETLAEDGVFQGRADGTFGPAQGLLRGQMATILTRLLGLAVDEDAAVPFVDAADGATHAGSIAAITASGLTDGCAQQRFCPDTVVTRGQLAAFLARAYDLPEVDADPFTDIATVMLADEIRAAAAAGVIDGFGDNTFRPNEPVTRAQAASMLLNAREAAEE